MLKTRAPASSGIGPGEGTSRDPKCSVGKQITKITRPGRILECLSYICSFKKNTASFKLFVVGQATPYKPSIYFNKCRYMVLPVLIKKSKEVCLFTSSNVGIQYCRLRSQCSIWTIINTSKYSSQAVL